jgi:hypothetical protein
MVGIYKCFAIFVVAAESTNVAQATAIIGERNRAARQVAVRDTLNAGLFIEVEKMNRNAMGSTDSPLIKIRNGVADPTATEEDQVELNEVLDMKTSMGRGMCELSDVIQIALGTRSSEEKARQMSKFTGVKRYEGEGYVNGRRAARAKCREQLRAAEERRAERNARLWWIYGGPIQEG